MNDLRPEIARIAAAKSDGERAQSLLECSPAMLMTCESTIRNRLMHAGFQEGLAYLDVELSFLRRARLADDPGLQSTAVCAARGRMERIMLGLPADRQVTP